MPTKAELEAALKTNANLTQQYWAAYLATSKRQGYTAATPQQAIQIALAGTGGQGLGQEAQAAATPAPWGGTYLLPANNATGRAFAKWWKQSQLTAQIYDTLHPQGFNWLGILPLVVIGGAGALLASGAVAGATGAAAASGAESSVAGASAATGAAGATATTATEVASGAVTAGSVAAKLAGETAATSAQLASQIGTISAAGSTAESVGSLLGGALTKLTGSSTVGDIVGSIVNEGASLIKDVGQYLEPLIKFGEGVLNDIETIDKTYIVPFTTLFAKEYDTITGAIGTIQTLSREGLQGILAIPQAIGGALHSFTSGFIAAADSTNANQSDLVKNTLAPAIATGVGEPVANLAKTLGVFARPAKSTVGLEPHITIPQTMDKGTLGSILAAEAEGYFKVGGITNDLFGGMLNILAVLADVLGVAEGTLEAAKVEGLAMVRPIPLDMAEAIEAWRREILDDAELNTELTYHGLADQRINVLRELAGWLPSEVQAMRMWARGYITLENFQKIMHGHGLNKTDAETLYNSELDPVNPREAVAMNGRMAMKGEGWLPHSLGSDMPAEYKALYGGYFLDPRRAPFDWAAHWKIPNIEWWFVAYFRGLVTKQDVTNAAKAENWPVEVIDNMFAVRQELIQEWMIPDILASGVMTDQEALDYMAYAGIDGKSAQILIKWAHSKGNAVTAGKIQSLADKFEAQSKAMYEDGLINKDEYQLLLMEMGFNEEQATLLVGLADNEFDFSRRKNLANLMVKRVIAGQMTLEAMQSYLLGQGFTLKEVELYVDAANAAIQDKTKQPSTAEVGDFLKKDIITFGEAVTAWRVDGWSDFWIPKLISYYGGFNVTIADATGPLSTATVTDLLNAQASASQSTTASNPAGSGGAAG